MIIVHWGLDWLVIERVHKKFTVFFFKCTVFLIRFYLHGQNIYLYISEFNLINFSLIYLNLKSCPKFSQRTNQTQKFVDQKKKS